MTIPRISLAAWLAANFDSSCRPNINTARRWCATGKIYPRPIKCGRAYCLEPHARYTGGPESRPRLLDRIRHDETAQPGESGAPA